MRVDKTTKYHQIPGRQSEVSTLVGLSMFVVFTILFINILQVPRTALDERESMRMIHDSAGLVVMLLSALCIYCHFREPKPSPPPGLPRRSFTYNRLLLLTMYGTFIVTGIVGCVYAFGEFDREIVFFGYVLPSFVQENDGTRKTFGYLHSALGFYYLFLFGVWIAFGSYQAIRYKAGILRLFPGPKV